jgi:hypothetical protein
MIQAGLQPTADQVLEHEKTLLSQQEQIGGNKQQIAANKADIETNQQAIAAHKQRIEQSESDIEANTKRFTALADYDVKGEATVKFASGSTKISAEDVTQLKQLAGKEVVWIHRRSDRLCRLQWQRCGEHQTERKSRESGHHGPDAAGQRTGAEHRGTGRDGRIRSSGNERDQDGACGNRRVEVKVLVNKGVAGS